MSPDAFRRLALFAAACAIAGALSALGVFVSWLIVGGALGGGVLLAIGATMESK